MSKAKGGSSDPKAVAPEESKKNKPGKESKDWEAIAKASREQKLQEEMEQLEEEETLMNEAPLELEHPNYKDLEKKLTETEMKMHEYHDLARKLKAEGENSLRRFRRDLEAAHKYGNKKFIFELLPILDSLEQALDTTNHKDVAEQSVQDGVKLTIKLFLKTLGNFGIKQIDPLDQVFDPNLHEAVSMQENDDAQAGTILQVYQKGYQIHDQVLRPARVIVAK